MREKGRGLYKVVEDVVVVVMVMMVAVKDTTAIPASTTTLHHDQEPAAIPANHVHDGYLDDALADWLNNFDTYTFMVRQDLEASHNELVGGGGGENEQEVAGAGEITTGGMEAKKGEVEDEDEDMMEGDVEEEWSAPIAVSVGSKTLLNPHLDYLVTVESLVAEEGAVFLTLSKYSNQTICGVGGFTVEAAIRSQPPQPQPPPPPPPSPQQQEANRPNIAGSSGDGGNGSGGGGGGGNGSGGGDSLSNNIVSAISNEGNITTLLDTSAWAEVSEEYWWGRGRLAGGGMLSITFTPPECGCLMLSAYYALPVGNMTLVVGPQAYPEELQVLLCIDPLALAPLEDDYKEEGDEAVVVVEEEEEEGRGGFVQESSALVAPRTTGQPQNQDLETQDPPPATTRRTKQTREGRRKERKERRQMKRQKIRQAGRRQARRAQRKQQILEGEGEEGADGINRARRRWKQQKRKGKKAWRRIKKGRKGRRRFHAHAHNHTHDRDHQEENVSGNITEGMAHHHHHHPHMHGHTNATDHHQEETLIDILLRDLDAENSPMEVEAEAEAEVEVEAGVEGRSNVAGEGGEDPGMEALTPKQRRKNRRKQRKMMRKERKKAHPPGVKFCCKQGIKHKKTILEMNSTTTVPTGDSEEECSRNSSTQVVSTFANHQFAIAVTDCAQSYATCCTRLTAEIWEGIKVKKMARRMERNQRRKSRRKGRKHRRKNGRRVRKQQLQRQDKAEEEPTEENLNTAEGITIEE